MKILKTESSSEKYFDLENLFDLLGFLIYTSIWSVQFVAVDDFDLDGKALYSYCHLDSYLICANFKLTKKCFTVF